MTVKEPDLEMKTRTTHLDACFRNQVDRILNTWAIQRVFITTYAAGSWGPEDSRLFENSAYFRRSPLTLECN